MSALPRILVVGNCQARAVALCIRTMVPGIEVQGLPVPLLTRSRPGRAVNTDVDLVLHHGDIQATVAPFITNPQATYRRFPRVVFRGYHPDMVHVMTKDRVPVEGPTRRLHSALALWGYKQGLSVDDTCALFNDRTMRRLGYMDVWHTAKAQLAAEGRLCGVDMAPLMADWARKGPFMHTFNHPTLRVLASVAGAVLEGMGVTPKFRQLDELIADPLRQGVWGVYPDLARAIGCDGGYAFMERIGRETRICDLREFVAGSFEAYGAHDTAALTSPTLDIGRFDTLLAEDPAPARRSAAPAPKAAPAAKARHPYADLPDHQFWRKAVAGVPAPSLDPVVEAPFRISSDLRVATAGSCFAQHIARTLKVQGYNYFVAEDAPAGTGAEEREARNFGVFSARYGNIYTARQLVQLFDRAYGAFAPKDSVWVRPDGRFADPFRPQIEPDGFDSPEAVEDDRRRHLAEVRRMFETLDVFVFTLGLTEGWRSLEDGAVFPLAPGVAAGEMDESRYGFVNFTTAEVAADLLAFIERLETVNPRARIIFTVSPVPLVATYENRHVLVSTVCSKAILRAAADDVCRASAKATYFPSFEIITGHYNKGAYFADDLRSVTPDGVAHVMDVFLKHFAEMAGPEGVELDPIFDVICDEEKLDACG